MARKKRSKSIRRSRAIALTQQEKAYVKTPHTMVFSRPSVGSLVKQLGLDVREVFQPFTATNLHVNRRNVLKDFITIAGPLNVTHLLYFTHPHTSKRLTKHMRQKERKLVKGAKTLENHNTVVPSTSTNDTPDVSQLNPPAIATTTSVSSRTTAPDGSAVGGVYLHLIKVPHGPSLTFQVLEYSLKRDVLTMIRRVFDSRQYRTPPLLAMTGFGINTNKTPGTAPHLRLIVDMFQNMFPPLNVQQLKLNSVRRVLLLAHEMDACVTDGNSETATPLGTTTAGVIYIRHYHIRTENRSISRSLRRLGMGGVKYRRKQGMHNLSIGGIGPSGSGKSSGVPDLSKFTSMDDFLTKSGLLSDSALSDALSDMEEVDLVPNATVKLSFPSLGLDPLSVGLSRKRKHKNKSSEPAHGLKHLGNSKKATIRLTEIGPRLTLSLLKVEEGVNKGAVLYHRLHVRSLTEVTEQNERLRQRELLRSARRVKHEARRAANEAAREAHRNACIEGMRRAGQLPKQISNQPESHLLDVDEVESDSNFQMEKPDSHSPKPKSALKSTTKSLATKHNTTPKVAAKRRVLKSNIIIRKKKVLKN